MKVLESTHVNIQLKDAVNITKWNSDNLHYYNIYIYIYIYIWNTKEIKINDVENQQTSLTNKGNIKWNW